MGNTLWYVLFGSGYISGRKNAIISWSKLSRNPSAWILEECYPERFPWADPSKLRLTQVFQLLDHWREREDDGLEPLIWKSSCELLTNRYQPSQAVRTQQRYQGASPSDSNSPSKSNESLSERESEEEDFADEIAKISDRNSDYDPYDPSPSDPEEQEEEQEEQEEYEGPQSIQDHTENTHTCISLITFKCVASTHSLIACSQHSERPIFPLLRGGPINPIGIPGKLHHSMLEILSIYMWNQTPNHRILKSCFTKW